MSGQAGDSTNQIMLAAAKGGKKSTTTGISPELGREIVAAAGPAIGGLASPDRALEFVEHYFKHAQSAEPLDRPADQIAALLMNHVELGMVRQPDQTLLAVTLPGDTSRWETQGRTVIQVITDDKPYVVDTLLAAASRLGWTVREVIHPQFGVIRDPQGKLLDMAHRDEGRAAKRESWVWVEATPPLGQTAELSAPGMRAALEAAMADLSCTAVDDQAMIEVMHAVAVSCGGVNGRMLHWLADPRHFVILGHRRYTISEGGEFAIDGEGQGLLREDSRASQRFHAVPRDDDREELIITKDSELSRVKESQFMDYIGVRLFDEKGAIVGEDRFLGLFTATGLAESVFDVPLLAAKANDIISTIGYDPESHGYEAVVSALESFPREELLHAPASKLFPIIHEISDFEERRRVRTYVRRGRWGRFVTVLVYFPRDRYNTAVRQRISQVLALATNAETVEWRGLVSESVLSRLYFTMKAADGEELLEVDDERLQHSIEQATRDWGDRFAEIADRLDSSQRGIDFSDAYKEAFDPVAAIDDLVALNQLEKPDDMAQIMYSPTPPIDGVDFRLKVLRLESEMILSDVLPHLSSLGVDVIDERPFTLRLRGQDANLYDFGLRLPGREERLDGWSYEARERFTQAFAASYSGRSESDGFNALVTTTRLDWHEITVLRAIARYLRQGGTTFSQNYIAATLTKNSEIAVRLIDLFEAKFDPDADTDVEARLAEAERIADEIKESLAEVMVADEDRIIRQYLSVLAAMVRTNFYARTDDEVLVFKFLAGQIDLLPLPRPQRELFVYSPRVEGVHLRFGPIARGGLRWSDRAEDYRTEILGLVKAQMVKNTVIVPTGAKGGFLPRKLNGLNPAQRAEEGLNSYRLFISGLLSVTDNIVQGVVVRPDRVVALDADDSYLVVAADKGTASLSDTANEIATQRGFWLGDAFASGGSHGYDHKEMGITARGAWEATKRHFGELEIGPDDDFTAVGIGDMSGDVFGNGMLLSEHIRLVGAFNHRHIFIDPDPDAATSFVERQRLFQLPRSSWSDYQADLISAGGGVFERGAKSVPVSPQMRTALGLPDSIGATMTPDQLVSAVLQAPVDLLFNGGIGTYVKAESESHQDVGDRANNAVRINGSQVRARCAVEGGNLGWTQLGRIEYAAKGGRVNTDFIDNSAGVDTSDHEVNIKILLDKLVDSGQLPLAERNDLLKETSDEVADLVLSHNRAQNQTLSNAAVEALRHAGAHEQLMTSLTEKVDLNRDLEGLPNSAEMYRRIAQGRGLTNPELCSLLAWVKIALKQEVLATELPDDPYLAERLYGYFPQLIRERFPEAIGQHPLARDIIATVAVNRFVDSQGISAGYRMSQESGLSIDYVIRAQLAARNLMQAGWLETAITKADGVSAQNRSQMRVNVHHLVERATRWFLHRWTDQTSIEGLLEQYKSDVEGLLEKLPEVLTEEQRTKWEQNREQLISQGAPENLATKLAGWETAHLTLPIVRIAQQSKVSPEAAAGVYFQISERSGVASILRASEGLPRTTRWDIMARSSVREELLNVEGELAESVLSGAGLGGHGDALTGAEGDAVLLGDRSTKADALLSAWLAARPQAGRISETVAASANGDIDLARVSVALRALRQLL